MRADEDGHVCPETLGEYRDLAVKLAGEGGETAALLDLKIAQEGRDAVVVAPDSQMRALLYPLIQWDCERRLKEIS